MLRNNNTAVIDSLSRKSVKNNRRRSLSMTFTVFLSAFMLFSVLTVGTTYFKMEKLQNIRLMGADFDAVVYGITDIQMALCRDNPDILNCGAVAVSGYVAETEKEAVPDVGLLWADETCWNDMMKPARKWIKGHYPTRKDEIMVTEKALKKCGFDDLTIGDTFTVTYGVQEKQKEQTFLICGIWDGYGPTGDFYVSEAFYKQTGLKLSDVSSGRYHIDFKQNLMSPEKQEAFRESMHLEKIQRLLFTGDFAYSVRILAGTAGLIFITCLCAYLLIYNIMYLSVAGNIRYYGLLQTIGMTGRQIYRLIYGQMLLIGGIGITGGLIAGCLVSFFLIPVIIESLGIRTGKSLQITVSFHPAIFLLTVLLTGVTIYIAGRKPAKTAVSCSPMEALGYRPENRRNRKNKHPRCPGKHSQTTAKGSLVWRLAKKQITKDRKKSAVVMLSLSTGISVFLCITTLITSQGAREFIYNDRNLDMVLKNDTLMKKEKEERTEIFNKTLLEKIKNTDGVESIEPVICTEITVPWEPDFADLWMKEYYETWMTIPYEDEIREYKEHPENFGSSLVGISDEDFRALNQDLDNPIDEDAFLTGKTCLLYRNSLNFTDSDLAGKTVTCAQYDAPENTRSFRIAGLTDINDYTALLGYPPTIIVSRQAVREFARNPSVFKLGVKYTEEYNKTTEKAILSTMNKQTKDYSYESKIELMENVKDAQGSMMETGTGIVFILALIGIMNYVNTFIGNVQNRAVELSILESIGMTEKQIKRMLVSEGLLYAAGALIITGTIGTAVTYVLYQSMNYMGTPFKIPALPVLGSMVLITAICAFVPAMAWRQIERRGAVTERIKGVE